MNDGFNGWNAWRWWVSVTCSREPPSPIENTLREPLPPSITKHKSNHTKEYPSFNEWNDSCNHSSKKKRKEMRVTILYLYITGPNPIDPCVSILLAN